VRTLLAPSTAENRLIGTGNIHCTTKDAEFNSIMPPARCHDGAYRLDS
jgi:hypothetical protein